MSYNLIPKNRIRKIFNGLIERKWGTSINPPNISDIENENEDFSEYEDDDKMARVVPDVEDIVEENGKFLNQKPAYNKILHSEVSFQLGEAMSTGKVNKRSIGPDGTISGTYDSNPYINSMIYEVEFHGRQVKEHAANFIAKNILTQVETDGSSLTIIEAIIYYRKEKSFSVPKANMHVVTRQGQNKLRKNTIGWSLLVKLIDSSEAWISLKDLKESHPCETTDFAKARGIAD